MNTREGKRARKAYRREGLELDPRKIFEGARVPVSESGDEVFLVGGSTPMTGFDSRWFWLVRRSPSGAEVILFENTGCVYIDPGTNHGYKNVGTRWRSPSMSIIRRWTYDGHAYKLAGEKVSQRVPNDKDPIE